MPTEDLSSDNAGEGHGVAGHFDRDYLPTRYFVLLTGFNLETLGGC